MKRIILLKLFLFASISMVAQSNFELVKGNKETVSFQSSANLIIIPAFVNGTQLNFIVDTGSARSLIYDIKGIDSLTIKKGRVLTYGGLGSDNYFEAYYSPSNQLRIGEHLVSDNAEILIMVNENFSDTNRLGIEINGVIGADLFKNLIVEIDYISEKMHFYRHTKKLPRRLRNANFQNFEKINNKPYIKAIVGNDGSQIETSLLVDSGSSDALLLRSIDSTLFNFPKKGFRDYLGYGLAGELFGRRSKVDRLSILDFDLKRSTVSFPDDSEKHSSSFNDNANGSIGGETLRRFDVILDYKNSRLSLYPNEAFEEGYYYNMAGLSLKLEGADLDVTVEDGKWDGTQGLYKKSEGQVTLQKSYITYKMIPKIIVASVTENSVAYLAGIREGDQIMKMNGRLGENLTITKASSFFYKNPYSNLKITYKRLEEEYDVLLYLKPIIE
ncbi:MAG: PDZ domain-containing protein [Nonlabens sp.]|uniref:PDZ domain-containing protein n=1 Tax=Nonlabens sp. TaxID=1888209 RepID=UPI003EF6BDC1